MVFIFLDTLFWAGRPGGPEFYISTQNNKGNHGPGSQGSDTEADSCFGKIVEGLDVVKRMQKQPGAGPMGFITNADNYIRIKELSLIKNNEL
jgi:cyclophilin family peptidyl-prolyl cis-trans isomerase